MAILIVLLRSFRFQDREAPVRRGSPPLGGRLYLPLFAFGIQRGEAFLEGMESRLQEIDFALQRLLLIVRRDIP